MVGAAVGLHRHRHRPGGLFGGCFSEGWGLFWPPAGTYLATSGDLFGHNRGLFRGHGQQGSTGSSRWCRVLEGLKVGSAILTGARSHPVTTFPGFEVVQIF